MEEIKIQTKKECVDDNTKRFISTMKKEASYFISSAYWDGCYAILSAYENLYGRDERYWKLIGYLDKNKIRVD